MRKAHILLEAAVQSCRQELADRHEPHPRVRLNAGHPGHLEVHVSHLTKGCRDNQKVIERSM